MKPATRWALVAAVAVVGAVTGYLGGRPAPTGGSAPAATAVSAQALMALTLPDLQGTPQPLAQWRGRTLVANFWATWCPPCRAELPSFARLSGEFAAKGVQFVAISIDSEDKVREFQQQSPIPFPVLIGGFDAMSVARALGNPSGGLPFTVVLTPDGAVRHTRLGLQPEGELRTLLTEVTIRH